METRSILLILQNTFSPKLLILLLITAIKVELTVDDVGGNSR
jgi:hypothetical protein